CPASTMSDHSGKGRRFMAAFAGLYLLAGLAVILFAILPNTPLRQWIRSRSRPRVVRWTFLGPWLVGLLLLLIFVPATPPPNTTTTAGADTTTLPPTSSPSTTSSPS